MATVRSFVRVSGGYGLSVVTGGLISLAVIPLVIIVAGTTTWAAIAVAQGVAGFGAVFVGAGWGVTGPTETARMDRQARGQFYLGSLISRVWLFFAVGTITSAVTIALVHAERDIAILALISALVPGLSAGWFFVGESSAFRFLLLETLPRQAGSLLGAVLLFVTHQALWFVTMQLLGGVVATILSSASILRRYRDWRLDLSLLRAVVRMRDHIPAVSMSAVSTLYVNLPIVVVQMFLPGFTATYALAERIMRLALYATRPFVQVTQGYVPHDEPALQLHRARRVMQLTIASGALGGVLYALFAPWVGAILSGGQLHIDYAISLCMGLTLAAMLISQVSGFTVLTSYRLTPALAWSTVAGAIAGVVLMIPCALAFGPIGVVSILALSELVVLAYQLVVLKVRIF